jgi:crotonobetainyl-CoA:carnitine CoA-transferase CaiB-like acyl-CoA transferase
MRTVAPHTGEHTDQVLGELGLPDAEIRSLREKKIVA